MATIRKFFLQSLLILYPVVFKGNWIPEVPSNLFVDSPNMVWPVLSCLSLISVPKSPCPAKPRNLQPQINFRESRFVLTVRCNSEMPQGETNQSLLFSGAGKQSFLCGLDTSSWDAKPWL